MCMMLRSNPDQVRKRIEILIVAEDLADSISNGGCGVDCISRFEAVLFKEGLSVRYDTCVHS